jgi:hypothetical protein
MAIEDYSTTVDGNTDLFPELMNPSAVNDGARALQAAMKAKDLDAFWRNLGLATGKKTSAYVSNSQISMTGNQTGDYHAGRRIRLVYPISTTKYGTISASSYDGGAALTTVTVSTDDASNLANEVGTPYLGPPVTNPTIPARLTQMETINAIAVAGAQNVAANGSSVQFGGLLIQWGSGTTNGAGQATITFDATFGAAPYAVVGTLSTASPVAASLNITDYSTTDALAYTYNAAGAALASQDFNWIAIGIVA